MSDSPGVGKQRRSRMVLVYAGPFAVLALLGLTCWKWPVAAERWYAYKYEQTQKAEYRAKLEKLGAKHPELLLSRWFHLVKDYGHPDEFAAIPLSVRRKGIGLFLGEPLKGDWWKDDPIPMCFNFPPVTNREDWEPYVGLLRQAMNRVDRPPSSAGFAIGLFYDVCHALALCGDDIGLAHLEDNLFNDAGLFPYQEDAITNCAQGPPGVVALAAYGNARAREDVRKGLQRLRRRVEVAHCIEEALKPGKGYRPENIAWLRAALADYEKQRAAEQAAAEARYQELAGAIRTSSGAGYSDGADEDHALHEAGRVFCRAGCVLIERVQVDREGDWRLWRGPMPAGEYAAFWKGLLEFDLWNLALPAMARSRNGRLVLLRAGERRRSAWLTEWYKSTHRFPDEPATWIVPLVTERFRDRNSSFAGRFAPVPSGAEMGSLIDRWLRGEPWEEIVKAAAGAAAPEAPSPIRP